MKKFIKKAVGIILSLAMCLISISGLVLVEGETVLADSASAGVKIRYTEWKQGSGYGALGFPSTVNGGYSWKANTWYDAADKMTFDFNPNSTHWLVIELNFPRDGELTVESHKYMNNGNYYYDNAPFAFVDETSGQTVLFPTSGHSKTVKMSAGIHTFRMNTSAKNNTQGQAFVLFPKVQPPAISNVTINLNMAGSDGDVIKGAEFVLYKKETSGTYTETDRKIATDGNLSFTDITPGNYKLE